MHHVVQDSEFETSCFLPTVGSRHPEGIPDLATVDIPKRNLVDISLADILLLLEYSS